MCVCSSLLSHSVPGGFPRRRYLKTKPRQGPPFHLLVFHNVVERQLEQNGPKGTDVRPQTTQQPDRNVFPKTWKYCKTHKNNPSPEKHEAWEQNRLQQQHSLYDWIIAIMSPSGTQLNALWLPRHLSIRRNNMQMSGQWLVPYFNLSSAIKSHT